MKYALGSAITPAGDPPAVHLEVEGLALTRRQSGDILGQGRDDLTGDVEELEGEAERLGRSRPQVGRRGGEGRPGPVREAAENGDLDREAGVGPDPIRLRGVTRSPEAPAHRHALCR